MTTNLQRFASILHGDAYVKVIYGIADCFQKPVFPVYKNIKDIFVKLCIEIMTTSPSVKL